MQLIGTHVAPNPHFYIYENGDLRFHRSKAHKRLNGHVAILLFLSSSTGFQVPATYHGQPYGKPPVAAARIPSTRFIMSSLYGCIICVDVDKCYPTSASWISFTICGVVKCPRLANDLPQVSYLKRGGQDFTLSDGMQWPSVRSSVHDKALS